VYMAGAELFTQITHIVRGIVLASCTGLMFFILGCGGGSATPSLSTTTPVPTPTGGGTPTPAGAPTVVSVSAGQPVTGVDINVSPPATSPPINAELLGVTDVNSGGSASNSGATIHRGSTIKVLIFGPGLNGGMTVTVSGPGDIAVSNIRPISSTSGTPGVAFDAAVSGSAALGARTVFLKTTNSDITTFTGGLEVIQ
jgi:hypothetical protein